MKSIKPWCIWIIASLFVPYQFLLQASPSVMIPELIDAFSITIVDISILSSCYFYSYTLLQVPSGILLDRFGAKKILVITILFCAASCLLFATTEHFFIAQLSRFMMGIVASTSVVGALYLASNWFSAQRFGLLAGLMEMLGMLGGAVGQATLAKSVAIFGWRQTMMLTSVIGFIIALAVWLFVNDCPEQQLSSEPVKQQAGIVKELLLVFKNYQLWVNGIYCGLLFAMLSGFAGLWSVPYLITRFGFITTSAANYNAIIFIGAAIGGPFLGWLAGRLRYYRTIMFSCALIAIFLFAMLIYAKHLSFLVLAVLLFWLGFSCGAYTISFIVAREHTSSDIRGAAMGFTNMMCIIIGAPIIQPLVGYLLGGHRLDSHTTIFSVTQYQFALNALLVCLGLAALSTLFLRQPKDY